MGVKIVTDSTCDLSRELLDEYDIRVVPLYVSWGEESYREGVDILPSEFYRRLQQRSNLPTTSQPSVGEFKHVYRELVGAGHTVISIHLASKLSGTYRAAVMARDAVGGDIQVVDSGSVSLGLGLQVLEAARAALSGGKDEALRIVGSVMKSVRFLCVLRSLEYLKRGGRIGEVAAFLGSILNIKPVISVDHGAILAVDKVRGFGQAVTRMVDHVVAYVPKGARAVCGIMHAAARETAGRLQEEVVGRLQPVEVHVAEAGPVIGTHAGPGSIGLVTYYR
ncbi:MAG: DegV family protein [Firmicutes bacterium]|nr:DegV family protein [Bacillota bacterium]